jgi:hypothetical protein
MFEYTEEYFFTEVSLLLKHEAICCFPGYLMNLNHVKDNLKFFHFFDSLSRKNTRLSCHCQDEEEAFFRS